MLHLWDCEVQMGPSGNVPVSSYGDSAPGLGLGTDLSDSIRGQRRKPDCSGTFKQGHFYLIQPFFNDVLS